MNDLRRTFVRHQKDFECAVLSALQSGWWIGGSQGSTFAAEFAHYIGTAYCVPVGNGTDALEIALRALLPRSADDGRLKVITVANAGGYATTACHLVGLQPVYVDIDEASQLIDIDAALAALDDHVLAIVATHLYGGVVDIGELRRRCDDAGHTAVAIIEDCAQAHGATLGAKKAGALGTISTFSFYPTKNLGAMGDGGAILTSDSALADRVRMLHQYGWSSKYTVAQPLGRNSRLDELQAALLLAQLPYLDQLNAERRSIVDRYRSACLHGITLVDGGPGAVAHLAVFMCDDRDNLRQHLAQNGVSSDIHYPILDTEQPAWRATGGAEAKKYDLPVSRKSVNRILSVPCFAGMTDAEVEHVMEALQSWNLD